MFYTLLKAALDHVLHGVLNHGWQASLLFVNAFAILNNERFLEKCAALSYLGASALIRRMPVALVKLRWHAVSDGLQNSL